MTMPITLAIGDAVWMQVVALVGTILTPFVGVVVAVLLARVNAKADTTKALASKANELAIINAELVEDVKTDLADRSDVQDAKLDHLTTVANGATTANLRTIAVQARRIAMAPNATAEDVEDAKAAQKVLAEHVAKQTATAPGE